jgi:hypothetical protein
LRSRGEQKTKVVNLLSPLLPPQLVEEDGGEGREVD